MDFTLVTLWGVVGLVSAGALGWLARRANRSWLKISLTTIAVPIAVLGVGLVGYWLWVHSGDRSARTLDLGAGVTYERVALDAPHRQVFHLAIVDLNNPCVELVTSDLDDDGTALAETGTEFVERTGAVLSVNVAFFYPFEEFPLWDSYPQSGDPVTSIGPVVIDGQWHGVTRGDSEAGLWLSAGQATAGLIPPESDFAVPARIVLASNGRFVGPASPHYARTVAAVDLDTNQLLLLVADGKQPGYSIGSSYELVSEFLIGRGADGVVEFDGGGSATMVGVVDGQIEVLNRPIHQRIPGRQRPVASHLGVRLSC